MYLWCLEQVGPQGREKFDHDLSAPLPGDEQTSSPAQTEDEGEAFMAAMAMAQQNTRG